ncbi:hypothetical protein Tco_0233113, partial [Tanacetum coccineum]
MSTHEQHTPTVPTSVVRNTGGRSGPQSLEEPTPDEVLGELTNPKRRHGNRRSRSPSPAASVFKRLKQNRPPSPRPRPWKEGGVFNRLGGKERSASACWEEKNVEQPDEESPDELMAEPKELPELWTLFTDGSSCIDGSGAGLI